MAASQKEFQAMREAIEAARAQTHTCSFCGTKWTKDGPDDFGFCSFKCFQAARAR